MEVKLNHVQAPRPDKVHIGLVLLSTDHTLEMDWAKLIGNSAAVFSSRVQGIWKAVKRIKTGR